MNRLMQTASALTLAAALAGVPMIAGAQQATDTTAKQAVDNAAQQTEQAAGATVNAAGEAVDAAGNKIDNAANATGQALDNAADATKETAQDAGQKLGGKSAEAARFILRAIDRELDRA